MCYRITFYPVPLVIESYLKKQHCELTEACARLHNSCINEDLADIELISSGEKSSQEALDAYFADMQAVPESPLGWG
jgi:hypothetical protein